MIHSISLPALLLFVAVMGVAGLVRADMMADSPVKFPKDGPVPSKHPPDRASKVSEAGEKDYYIFPTPERSLAQIKAIQSEMPAGRFSPPPADWAPLERTRRILTEGGELRLLAMGDSIVNDTMRSGWVAKLQEAYPKADIKATVYVRGRGGCQHYREEGRLAKNVVPRKPNLVFIGGISQQDIESIRDVIRQLRAALPEVEILLATGAFGTTDPRDAEALAQTTNSGTGAYGAALKKLAADERCAYLDMTTPWVEYILSTKLHPHLFYRDVVHANEPGEQILSKIMMAFWTAPAPDGKNTMPEPSRASPPPTVKVKVAAIALATVDGMMDANYQRALRLTEIAAQDHPDIILLPEVFAAGYGADDLAPYAETLQDSKHLEEFRRRSRQYDCMIVLGYLERCPDGLRNAAAVFDRGQVLGVHYKSSLWPDDKRPYRDERRLVRPGKGMEAFPTRFGRMGILICYENMIPDNWRALEGKADLVISPYNCEDDPSRHNIGGAQKIGVPSAWADRTGTVYCGAGRYTSNPGTAGMVDAAGKVLGKSKAGVEEIVIGTIEVRSRQRGEIR